MLMNFSFFQCFSIPGSGATGWTEGQSLVTAEQRREVGCAVCARKDWLEHRYRVYLWREPEAASTGDAEDPDMLLQNPSVPEELGNSAAHCVDLSTGHIKYYLRAMNEECYCVGDAAAVNTLLSTSRYSKLMPCILEEELYAYICNHGGLEWTSRWSLAVVDTTPSTSDLGVVF